MKSLDKISKPQRNYYVDVASLLPLLVLLFTGIIMLMYHTGKPTAELTLGLNADVWIKVHVISAVLSVVMISIHLSLHLNWFKKLFTGKLKNKYWGRNLTLVILFVAATFTAFIPLIFLDGSSAETMLLGIHNKLGLLFIVFFIIHLLGYSKWLISMTKKAFIKTDNN